MLPNKPLQGMAPPPPPQMDARGSPWLEDNLEVHLKDHLDEPLEDPLRNPLRNPLMIHLRSS